MTIWYDAATNSWTGGTQRGEALAKAGVSVSSYSGAKTGKKYEVGKSYSMGSNGDTYRANADGTFTNNRTGGSLAGSSSADGVSFYGTVSSNGADRTNKPGGVTRGETGSGPGNGTVKAGGVNLAPTGGVVLPTGGVGPGSPGVVSRQASGVPSKSSGLTLDLGKPANVTQIVAGGHPIRHDQNWSDAGEAEQRWGDGDGPWSPTFWYNWSVAGADILNEVRERGKDLDRQNGGAQGGNGWNEVVLPWIVDLDFEIRNNMSVKRDGKSLYVTGGGF